jgi:hypothetical protein
LRVQVWRKLRSLGALYLQQSVCLLRRGSRWSGRCAGWSTGSIVMEEPRGCCAWRFTDPTEECAVIAEMNPARDDEYAEVLERLPELRPELAAERARGNATYAEVEESKPTWTASALAGQDHHPGLYRRRRWPGRARRR